MLSLTSNIFTKSARVISGTQHLYFSVSASANKSYDLVVVGGGAGGCAMAAKFAPKLGEGKVAIIDPADTHYYQPMWTLVGGGMKTVAQSGRPMKKVLPKKADWIKNRCVKFDPDNNKVMTDDGKELSYKYLIVAMGIQPHYEKITGLLDGLNDSNSGVCSNYSPLYVNKTFQALQNFKKGNAVFTYPNTPIKCAGAPQKIMYISEDYFRRNGKRDDAKIIYHTSLPKIFGVQKYADSLWEIVKARGIDVNLRSNLKEVRSASKEAVFEDLDNPEKTTVVQYEMLHVTPPMSAPDVLKDAEKLVDASGFLDVHKHTLQHVSYKNVFGIGDCLNTPNAKTAAAVAGQCGVLSKNLKAYIKGSPLKAAYDGYASCPLVTGYSKCILAEFDYNLSPLETFPLNQAKERRTMFHLKKDLMPDMYWHGLLNGFWNGPGPYRSLMHLGLK